MMDTRGQKDIRVCEPRNAGDFQKLEKQGPVITSVTPCGRLIADRSGQCRRCCPGDEHRRGQDLSSQNNNPSPLPLQSLLLLWHLPDMLSLSRLQTVTRGS